MKSGRTDDVLRAVNGTVLVLSPHFDDAVLSCGAFLAGRPGCIVLTACTQLPPAEMPAPDWDRRCGFGRAREAVQSRMDENRRALQTLGAVDAHLDTLDSQYGGHCEGLEAPLSRELSRLRPGTVLFPLGLFHGDHIGVSDAALRVRTRAAEDVCWIAYEDALYRRRPGLVQERLGVLGARGIQLTPWLSLPAEHWAKRRAVAAYASQLEPLGLTPGWGDDVCPEHYWKLTGHGSAPRE